MIDSIGITRFLFFAAFSYDILRPLPEVSATFEKFAWEFRSGHTDDHSSGESSEIKKLWKF